MPPSARDPPPHLANPPGSSMPLFDTPNPNDVESKEDEMFDGGDENIFRDMTFDEVLEDLNARFLVNLPKEEMSLVRVYWQAEQAHWFYEDYLRPLNPLLPSLSQKHFTHLIIASSPLYTGLTSTGEGIDYEGVWVEYCSYKRMVPVCGGILINESGDKALMVRGWKSNAGWCFPRGKINSEESEEACAIREVEEETGFDLTGRIVSTDKIQTQINAQTVTMFIVGGIKEDTVFQTQTRMEIGAIEWVKLTDLPTWTGKRGPKTTGGQGQKKFYNVTPFVGPLKRWLAEHGFKHQPKSKASKKNANANVHGTPQLRDLQPYQFDTTSPIPQPQQIQHGSQAHQSHPHSTSALDALFTKFVHVQQEELEVDKPVGGESTRDGLERLFGNLVATSHHPSAPSELPPVETKESEEDRLRKEDDALARLLGALATPTPAPPEVQAKANPDGAATGGRAKLLAVLNQKALTASAPVEASEPNPSSPQFGAGAIASPNKSPQPPVKPHQASLLAMLSPPPRLASNDTALGALPTDPALHSATSTKPISLTTSPRPPSLPADPEEERKRKQKALLEMTMAGIGRNTSSVGASNSSTLEPFVRKSHALEALSPNQRSGNYPCAGEQQYGLPTTFQAASPSTATMHDQAPPTQLQPHSISPPYASQQDHRHQLHQHHSPPAASSGPVHHPSPPKHSNAHQHSVPHPQYPSNRLYPSPPTSSHLHQSAHHSTRPPPVLPLQSFPQNQHPQHPSQKQFLPSDQASGHPGHYGHYARPPPPPSNQAQGYHNHQQTQQPIPNSAHRPPHLQPQTLPMPFAARPQNQFQAMQPHMGVNNTNLGINGGQPGFPSFQAPQAPFPPHLHGHPTTQPQLQSGFPPNANSPINATGTGPQPSFPPPPPPPPSLPQPQHQVMYNHQAQGGAHDLTYHPRPPTHTQNQPYPNGFPPSSIPGPATGSYAQSAAFNFNSEPDPNSGPGAPPPAAPSVPGSSVNGQSSAAVTSMGAGGAGPSAMHQPTPRSGVQMGLLAMLNDGRR